MITPPKPKTNPWRLSPAQMRVIESLAELGGYKLVARKLNLSDKTVDCHMQEIKFRMKARNLTEAAVRFDRWDRLGRPPDYEIPPKETA